MRNILLSLLLLGTAAVANTPRYVDAARDLDAAIASSESAGHAIVVVYVDEDDEGVRRWLGGGLRVTVDGAIRGKLGTRQRYLLFTVRAGHHTIGIDQGRMPVVRRVLEIADGSRHFLRYVRSIHPTTEATLFDVQIANTTTLESIEEDTARDRIATIQGLIGGARRR